jgi:hypothetical protein
MSEGTNRFGVFVSETYWIGDKQNGICITNEDDDGVVDEIVMYVDGKCVMHLEAMSDFCYDIALYTGDHEAHVSIGSRSLRAIVDATVKD